MNFQKKEVLFLITYYKMIKSEIGPF